MARPQAHSGPYSVRSVAQQVADGVPGARVDATNSGPRALYYVNIYPQTPAHGGSVATPPQSSAPQAPATPATPVGPQANEAVMHMPQITGGGESIQIGAFETRVILPQRSDEFMGLDSFTPEEKLPLSYSPHCVNWNAIEVAGSRCVRRGYAKMLDDREGLTDAFEEEVA